MLKINQDLLNIGSPRNLRSKRANNDSNPSTPNKKLMTEKNEIDVANRTKSIYEEYSSFYSQLQNADIEKVLSDLQNYINIYNDPKMKIACFGVPGSGKSSLINYLITGKERDSILPADNSCGRGCTSRPIICNFSNDDKFSVKQDKEFLMNNFTNLYDLSASLRTLMRPKSENIITVTIPNKIITNKKLEQFELIDLVGVPDKSNNKIYELNKEALKSGVDAVFLVKSYANRGITTTSDIIELQKCDAFKSGTFNSQPKFVLTYLIGDIDEMEYIDQADMLKYQLMQSISDAFDFRLKESQMSEIKRLNVQSEKYDETLLKITNKNVTLTNVCDRLDSLLLVKNSSIENHNKDLKKLDKVLNDIREHKLKLITRKCLQTALFLNKKMALKIKSYWRRREADKNPNKLFKPLVEHFEKGSKFDKDRKIGQARLIEELGQHFYQNNLDFKIIEDSNQDKDSQINNFFEPYFNEVIKRIKRELLILVDNIKTVSNLPDTNNKLMDLDELDDDFFQRKLELEAETSKSSDKSSFKNSFYLTTRELLRKNEEFKEEDWENAYLLGTYIQKFWENITNELKMDVLSDMQDSISDFYNKILIDLDTNKSDIEALIGKNKLQEIEEIWPTPKLFTNKKTFKLAEPGSSLLNLAECITEKYIFGSPKNPAAIEHKASELRAENFRIDHKEVGMDRAQNDFGYPIQLDIDFDNRKITAEYNLYFMQRKINNLMERLSRFECNHMESTTTDQEIEDFYEKLVLNPIFIYLNLDETDDNLNLKKSILLEDLSGSISTENMLLFLFVEAGQPERPNENNLQCLRNLIEKERAYTNSIDLPIVTVFINKELKNRNQKEKLMMLFADHLNIAKFYIVSDTVKTFYEIDRGYMNHKTNNFTTAKCLYFMSKVLKSSTSNISNEEDLLRNKTDYLRLIFELENSAKDSNPCSRELDELSKILSGDQIKEKKIYAIHLMKIIYKRIQQNLFNITEEKRTKFMSMIKAFSDPYSTVIGDISLINQSDSKYYSVDGYHDRLVNKEFNTHCINRQKTSLREVVLYNLDTLQSIHPITIEEFFTDNQESFDNDDYFFLKALNRISSLILYYFSYTNND